MEIVHDTMFPGPLEEQSHDNITDPPPYLTGIR